MSDDAAVQLMDFSEGDDGVFLYTHVLGENEEEAPALQAVFDQNDAERHLRAVAYWTRKQAEDDAHAEREMARIAAWLEKRSKTNQFYLRRHESALQAFLHYAGKKALKLVYGSFKMVQGRERVEVRDPEAALAWARTCAPNCIRIKEEIDKTAVKKFAEAGNALPTEVLAIERGPDEFKVEVPE